MTTFPLPTMACTVIATGISAPPYADIFANLQYLFQSIYGSDIYVDPDSQDGQMLGIVAQAINDSNNATIATYNQFSPATAQGTGLSSVVKINGLQREASGNSTADLTVVGTVGADILNGVASDGTYLWNLPASVVVPGGGSIVVTATCQTAGAINAAPSTIVRINTPTSGWQSVNNVSAATPGAPVETDSTLRQRQAASTALPAVSVIGGIYGTVANLPGVQRLLIYDNDTGSSDVNGIPAHSISVVVSGGDAMAIAQTIEQKKTPGTGTYGSTSELVYDPAGLPITISFYQLAEVVISVTVSIKALSGYVSTTATLIKQAVAGFLNALAIGEISYLGRLWGPANLSGDAAVTATGLAQTQLDLLSATYTVLAISQSRSASPAATTVNGTIASTAVTGTLHDVSKVFVGSVIQFVMDNAATLNVTVATVNTTSKVITFAPAIPSPRNVPDASNVYLVSDVNIAFNEAAEGVVADVTVNAA